MQVRCLICLVPELTFLARIDVTVPSVLQDYTVCFISRHFPDNENFMSVTVHSSPSYGIAGGLVGDQWERGWVSGRRKTQLVGLLYFVTRWSCLQQLTQLSYCNSVRATFRCVAESSDLSCTNHLRVFCSCSSNYQRLKFAGNINNYIYCSTLGASFCCGYVMR
jgi:hypothetical protein